MSTGCKLVYIQNVCLCATFLLQVHQNLPPCDFYAKTGSSEAASRSPDQSGDGTQENSQTQQDFLDTPRLEQREEMNFLEWEGRMKVLALEQELLKEKRQAVRIKKAYYKAKMRRLGEALPASSAAASGGSSSSSSSDGEEKMPPLMR